MSCNRNARPESGHKEAPGGHKLRVKHSKNVRIGYKMYIKGLRNFIDLKYLKRHSK
jgi:hypothetical protein